MGVTVAQAQAFLAKERNNIAAFHGGMPQGVIAAIAIWESSGNNNVVSSLGEVGYLQVTTSTCDDFKVDCGARYNPAGNLFLGCLNYNVDAARISKRFPWIKPGSTDQWLFSRLVSAIGIGATQNLLKKYTNNDSYDDFAGWANAGNASGNTLSRINGVVTVWNVGQATRPESPSYPTKIPAYLPYTLPNDVKDLMVSGNPLLNSSYYKYYIVAGAAALAYWLI